MTKNLLEFFNSNPLKKNQIIGGPDQDDADSIISSAALRFLSAEKQIWNVPNSSKKEGWIFGVQINITYNKIYDVAIDSFGSSVNTAFKNVKHSFKMLFSFNVRKKLTTPEIDNEV